MKKGVEKVSVNIGENIRENLLAGSRAEQAKMSDFRGT